jgi:hypothetical protein
MRSRARPPEQSIYLRLSRSVGSIDLSTGVAHLRRERAQQVAAACAVAGFARLLQRGGGGTNANCTNRLRRPL